MSSRRAQRWPLEELAPYLLEMPNPPAPLDWRAVFGSEQPVEVEVGFGKGLFLVTMAPRHPDVNYLGIEIARKYQLLTANRLARRRIRNVRLVCADARAFLRACVAPQALQAIHVYFPDPWWKKRHGKRRVFTEDFVAQCERTLRPGGCLHVATDVVEYFEGIIELLTRHTRLRPLPPPAPSAPVHDLDYLTNFERKFRKEGKTIYRACCARPGAEEAEGSFSA